MYDLGDLVRITYPELGPEAPDYVGMIVGLPSKYVGYTVLMSTNSPDGPTLLGSIWEQSMTKVPDDEVPQFKEQFPQWSWDCVDPNDIDGSSAPPSAITAGVARD